MTVMHRAAIELLRSAQQHVTCIHWHNVTPNLIGVFLPYGKFYEASFGDFYLISLHEPCKLVRVWMVDSLKTKLLYHGVGDHVLATPAVDYDIAHLPSTRTFRVKNVMPQPRFIITNLRAQDPSYRQRFAGIGLSHVFLFLERYVFIGFPIVVKDRTQVRFQERDDLSVGAIGGEVAEPLAFEAPLGEAGTATVGWGLL